MKSLINRQKTFFNTNATKKIAFRINNLIKLKNIIKLNEPLILDALQKDLGKSTYEAYVTEIGILYQEIDYMIKNLPKWIKPRKVKTPLTHLGSKSYIISEPYGVVLIISPWNYPFQLALNPLIGAIASGNTAIIKPSEYSVNTTEVLVNIINDNFKDDYLKVVTGDGEFTAKLLDEKFDYIFFTGSTRIGKIVMEKASRHLTPITLELGGKSPCIVYSDADIDLAAKRIIFGKFLNAGQTCVAPDYLLVHRDIKESLVSRLILYIEKFYQDFDTYPRIINSKHLERLSDFLKDKKLLYGGKIDKDNLKITPTLLDDISLDDPLMNEEIFGPILPILDYDDIQTVIDIVKSKPKPLSLYLFTNNNFIENKIIKSLSFGGGCINDTIMHLATPYLPFGGVGESGVGSYHGVYSFKTFSHDKSILKRGKHFDIELRYPPFTEKKYNLIKKIMK